MYKVKNQDKIPVHQLTDEAITARVVKLESTTPSEKLKQRIVKLNQFFDKPESITLNSLMGRIYSTVDAYMDEMVYPGSVCRPSCAHCCKLRVQLTAFEANYITLKTGITLNPDVTNDFEEDTAAEMDYCPFLNRKTALCEIFEYRPLACRSFTSIDSPALCQDIHTPHMIHNTKSQPALQNIYHWLVTQANAVTSQSDNKTFVADIRDWFKP